MTKKTLNKTKRFIKNNYQIILISITLAVIGHAYFLKNQFLNNQFMMGPYDQFSQMTIFKDLLYDEFSQGNFFYSFNFNGGANIFTRLSYYYSTSIIFYITALFTFALEQLNVLTSTGIVYWASIGVFISIFRSAIILFVTTKYIEIFNINRWLSLLGATFYAFSSIYFRHVALWEFFGDAMIWLPIILLGVEYIIRDNDGKLFTVGVALTMFNNGYFAFANLLFTLIYIILRLIFKLSKDENKIVDQIKNYLIYGLIGTGISLPGFIPFVLGFISTSRLSPEFTYSFMDFTDMNLGNLLLNDRIQILPILYIIVITYFSNYKSRKFRFFSILSVLLIFFRYSPFVASLFNGMSYPQFRWHYATFLIIAIVIALGMRNIFKDLKSQKHMIYLFVSFILTIGLYVIADKQVDDHCFNTTILFSIIGITYLLIILMCISSKRIKYLIFPLLFISSLYTVFVTNRQLYYDYKLHTMNYDEIYQTFEDPNSSYERALKKIKNDNDEFYRIDFTDMRNLASQKNFNSFNMYSSFQNKYQQYFYRYFKIENSRENNGTIDGLAGRQTLNSIFQNDYVIAVEHDKYIIPSSFEMIDQVDDLSIYKNRIPLSFIHPVEDLYSYNDIEYNDYKDDLLIDGAIVPEELSNTAVSSKSLNEEIDFFIENIDTDTKDNVLLNSDEYFDIDISLNSNRVDYDDLVIDYTIKPLDNGEKGRYTYSVNDYSIQLKSTGDPYSSQLYRHQVHIPYDDEINFHLASGTDYVFEIHSIYGISHDRLKERSEKDQNLEYDVQQENGKINIIYDNNENYPFMVLPLFYELGWELQINKEEVDVVNVNEGMVGFEIPTGEMEIILEFKQPFLKSTLLIASTSLLILVVIERKPENKK